MIISDLEYFEGFAEAPNIVGGVSVKLGKLDPQLASELKAAGVDPQIINATLNVKSTNVNVPGKSASATSGSGQTGTGKISYSSADSTVAKKK